MLHHQESQKLERDDVVKIFNQVQTEFDDTNLFGIMHYAGQGYEKFYGKLIIQAAFWHYKQLPTIPNRKNNLKNTNDRKLMKNYEK